MRIAEVVTRSGLSADTIRYYEKVGIIPRICKGNDGRRCFTPENVEWLTLLYWLRETGMPIKTMRRFAALYHQGDATIADRTQILLEHSALLKKRRTDLDRCEDLLSHKISIYEKLIS